MSSSAATASLPTIATAVHSGRPEAARRTAEEFEAVFLNQLLESMSYHEEEGAAFSGGPSEGIYRSMMNDSVAKAIAKRGGIGIADAVYRQILELQEQASHGSPPDPI